MDLVQNSALRGNPDWQTVIRAETFDLLGGFADGGLFFAFPTTAILAHDEAGKPQFFLEFFSDKNEPSSEDSLYAMLSMQLRQAGELYSAYQYLNHQKAGVALMPMTFTSGTYWHLECGDIHESSPFAWDGTSARIQSRISSLSGRLLYAALARGSTAVARTAIECSATAFLPRLEANVKFNTANLLAALVDLNPGAPSVPFQRIVAFLQTAPKPLLQIEGSVNLNTDQIGLAIAGRVRHYFGAFAACPRISDGPHIQFSNSAITATTIDWDLRTPFLTETPIFINYDPFTVILDGKERDQVTAFTRVPSLPDQLRTRTVIVAAGLPPNILGCVSVQVTLRVDKELSDTGSTAVQYVTIYPSQPPSSSVDLKYARIDGDRRYSAKVTVEWEDNVTETDWLAGDDYLFVDSSRLPGTYVTVRATDTLLADATIKISVAEQGWPANMTADLNSTSPVVSLSFSSLDPAARLSVVASSLSAPADAVSLDLPCRSTTLDCTSFREFGPQAVDISVCFHDDIRSLRLELIAEAADALPIVRDFSAEQPTGTFNYLSESIFRNGYLFRAAGVPSGVELQWSARQLPQSGLTLDVYHDGIRQRRSVNG